MWLKMVLSDGLLHADLHPVRGRLPSCLPACLSALPACLPFFVLVLFCLVFFFMRWVCGYIYIYIYIYNTDVGPTDVFAPLRVHAVLRTVHVSLYNTRTTKNYGVFGFFPSLSLQQTGVYGGFTTITKRITILNHLTPSPTPLPPLLLHRPPPPVRALTAITRAYLPNI